MVIDTSALIAILKQEPDAAEIIACLGGAERRLLSAGTALECGIVVASKFGPLGRERLSQLIRLSGIEIVPFDEAQVRIGIDARLRYGRGSGNSAKLNFGDCFAYALAKARNLPLLFKGDDFIHTDVEPALGPAR